MVVVVLGILAAVAIPAFASIREDARTQSAITTLAGVRASIASFRERAVIAGADPFPTLAELTTTGAVLDHPMDANPWSGLATVRSASGAEADARTIASADTHGWAYHVDNGASPPRAVFYANSSDATTRTDPSDGSLFGANEL